MRHGCLKVFLSIDNAITDEDVVSLYQRYDEVILEKIKNKSWYADYLYEKQYYQSAAEDSSKLPPPMPATAQYDLLRSRLHPIRALTSGPERLIDSPFYAGGRWRFTARQALWEDYDENTTVVVGYYWRQWGGNHKTDVMLKIFSETEPCMAW